MTRIRGTARRGALAPHAERLLNARGPARVATLLSSAADFMCKECVSVLAYAISLLCTESPMRLVRRGVQSRVNTHEPVIHVVPEVGVEPTRF
jgi:hypothetical protein